MRDKRGKEKNSEKHSLMLKPGQKHFWYLANLVMLCTITLLALIGAALCLVRVRNAVKETNELKEQLEALQGDAKTLYTEEEVQSRENQAKEKGASAERDKLLMQIQSSMESGGSTASMLRELFSDDIVVVNGGKYYFYPILNTVKRNSFQSADFSLSDDGRLLYSGGDKVKMQSGIDVSEDNGDINWQSVSEDDVAFAMICAGGRKTDAKGKSSSWEDDRMGDNIQGASEAGLHVGIYYVLGASSAEEAEESAEQLIQSLESYEDKITYPVAVWVNQSSEDENAVHQSRADCTDYVLTFCEALDAAGYEPLIYGNLASFVMGMNIEDLEKYDKWIANTGAGLYFPYQFSMWQYSTTGTVHGISTEVGLDASLTVG